MTNKVTEAIDEMVREKTFSLDALNAINDLKTKARIMEGALDAAQKDVAKAKEDARLMSERYSECNAEVNAFKTREADLEKRERAIFEHEKASAVAQARSQAFGEAFGMVFRNTVVRETVNKSVPVAGPGGVMLTGFEGGTVERTTE
jgi:chromosome segregation ATPase